MRPASAFETSVAGGLLRRGSAQAAAPRRLYPQYRTLEAMASVLPLGLSRGLLAYLDGFPHPCTEQLVSRAFVALILQKHQELGYRPEKSQSVIAGTLHTLRARQNAEGAFGFWAANSDLDPFQTIYAVHFLTQAKEAGVDVSAGLFNRALAFIESAAADSTASPLSPRHRAYALYILTRNGRVTTDRLEALRRGFSPKDLSWRRDITAAYMASAYKLLRLDAQAESLIKQVHFEEFKRDQCDYGSYYDGLAHNAQLLALTARHFPDRMLQLRQKDWDFVVEPVINNQFNTLTAAYAVLAFDAAAGTLGATEARAAEVGASGRKERIIPRVVSARRVSPRKPRR